MIKRLFDFFFSLFFLLLLSPFFLFIALWIKFDSRGSVFYLQSRVGKNEKEFKIFKFRSMHADADKKGLITVGGHDPRITRAGYFLRKYKLDELPQLINVFIGNMSVVGPRPEVKKYTDLYNAEQKKVLQVKPGITDYASIEFSNENELLNKAADWEQEYINVIMPRKLLLNLKYISEQGFFTDMKIIFLTAKKILGKRNA